MSGDANSTHTSESGYELCPTCHQPRITSNASDVLFPLVPSAKRKKDTPPGPVPSAVKKLRHFDKVPTGQFSRLWDSRPKYPVWVRVHGRFGGRRWDAGIVDRVIDHGDGQYKIVVHIEDDEGNFFVPSTINPHNQDPIPSVNSSDPNYKLGNYIAGREECLDGLSDALIKHWRCLKYHSGGTFDRKTIPEQNIIGKSLLDDDPNSPTSMRNLVHSLLVNKDVKCVIKEATGEEEFSAQHALAYFIGQLCGIELSESGY